MDAALSIALGYFVGSLSPSSLVGRVKKTDVRKSGTGNLGATNTMLVLGWGAGIFVMLFDLMKSFLSGKLAQYLFPGLSTAGMLACIGAMIGHCFSRCFTASGEARGWRPSAGWSFTAG